ncbi:MAG: thiosulfohydrolase SoxB [Deinococcales bacterium]
MAVSRRDLLKLLALGGVFSAFNPKRAFAHMMQAEAKDFYDIPAFGNVSLLHTADIHAHMRPHYFMDPPNLLAPINLADKPGYLFGQGLMNYYGVESGSLMQYMTSAVDFASLAQKYGKMGGCAEITSLIKQQRALLGEERCLTLDGGDTWTNTGISLLTKGQLPVDWMNLTGYDHMVAHWEFTLGRERFEDLIDQLEAHFISHNVVDELFNEPLYDPYAIHEVGGASIGIIGATFPYVKVSHPQSFTPELSFGVREQYLQRYVDEIREQGVDAVILLSHHGFPLDIALAQQLKGIDVILTSHTHDVTLEPYQVGETKIISSGSSGKFVARLDLDVGGGKVRDVKLNMLPVLSDMLSPDPDAKALIDAAYAEHESVLSEKLGVAGSLIYKRDSVFSSFDRLAGMAVKAAYPQVDVAFSPAYRWGTTLIPGQEITMEQVLDFTGITYPELYLFKMKGERLKQVMEDIAENVFQPNPFYQQGGDMSRLFVASYDPS